MRNNRHVFVPLILLMSIVSFIPARAQSPFEQQDDQYKGALKEKALSAARENVYTKKMAAGDPDVIVAPFYQFRYYSNAPLPDTGAVAFLSRDTSYAFAVLSKGGRPFAYGAKSWSGEFNIQLINDPATAGADAANRMIQKAAAYSKRFFFVNFIETESQHNTVGFLVDGRLKFLDADLDLYDNPSLLILKKWGSAEKYVELCRSEKEFRELYAKMIPEEEDKKIAACKKVVSNDYMEFIAAHGEDSSKAAGLLIGEIASIINLTDLQKELLMERIMNCFRKYCPPFVSLPGVQFYGKNIYSALISVLTEDQFQKYMRQRKLNGQLARAAASYLYAYYQGKVVPKGKAFASEADTRQTEAMFRKEVFGK